MSPQNSGTWALCVLSFIIVVIFAILLCTYVCSARSRRSGYYDIDGNPLAAEA